MDCYKTSNIVAKDNKELLENLTNEYGFNYDSIKKSKINKEALLLKHKNIVNKDYIKQFW